MLDFETIEKFYNRGLWSSQLVEISAKKGILTEEQVKKILNKE